MTYRQWNKAIKLMTQIQALRMSLDGNDPAREHLYQAELELEKVSRFTIPAR